jgi:hypothetical protein
VTRVQEIEIAIELLKKDPSHPSLHFKPLGKFWSVRVGIHHRALAIKDGSASLSHPCPSDKNSEEIEHWTTQVGLPKRAGAKSRLKST